MDRPLLPEVLSQHGEFVRALAHSLLGDPGRAEDVAQETWLRYFERTPRAGGSLRHWFRTVTRNLARNATRGERHRAARDERAARPEALPSAADEFAQADLLRVMVDAVLTLEEPQCSTILSRYFRGWSAARIAAETGTPLATVRSREQRALGELREKLDRKFEGGRAAWGLALGRVLADEGLTAAATAGSAAVSGAGSVAKASLVAAGVVLGGVLAWRVLSPGPGSRASAPGSPPAVESAQDPRSAARVSASEPAESAGSLRAAVGREPRDETSHAPGAPEAEPSAALHMTALPQAELRGRFVFSNGTPAAGVPFTLIGSRVSFPHFTTEAPENQSGASGPDGRFSVTFTPTRWCSMDFSAGLEGMARVSWYVFDVAPGEVKDLGDVELLAGAVLEGRLVNASDEPILGEEWKIHADSVGVASLSGREETTVIAALDPATGHFRIEGVMPGTNVLKAYSSVAVWAEGPQVTVGEGETVTVDIPYAGPDSARRIAVSISMRPFHSMPQPAPEHVRLLGAGPEPLVATETMAGYSFDGLEPGSYTLEIDDPRCIPWRQEGVHPGTGVNVRLEGSATLFLNVVDGETKEPVEGYSATVTLRNVPYFPNVFPLNKGEPLPAGGRIGMFPGDSTVSVRAGDRVGSIDVNRLQAGETRALTILVRPQDFVAGRVTFEDGTAIAGLDVLLLRPAAVGDSNASPILRWNGISSDEGATRKEIVVTTSDAQGNFRFDAPNDGSYLVHAATGDGTETFSEVFPSGESRSGLELVLSRSGSVSGTIHVPGGGSPAGLRVRVLPDSIAEDRRSELGGRTTVSVGADGRFQIPSVCAGRAQVFFLLPQYLQHNSGYSGMGSMQFSTGRELGTVDVPAGGAVERDFTIAEFPGSLELTVRVNGQLAPRLALRLVGAEEIGFVQVETDDNGVFGPAPIFAGTWSIEASDPRAGWRTTLPDPVVVASGLPTITELALQRP